MAHFLDDGLQIVANDFDGNRVSRTSGAGDINYLVDTQSLSGVPQVLEEHDGSGSLLASYGYGADLFMATRAGADSYYHPDLHGSTRLLTDSAEAVTDRYDYEGYGGLIASTGSFPSIWCFSAAILSLFLYFFFRYTAKRKLPS